MAFRDRGDIIDLWTSEFLKDFRPRRPKSARSATSKQYVAFGRTMHEIDLNPDNVPIRPQTVPILLPSGRDFNRMITLQQATKLSDSRIQQTNEYLTRLTELLSQSKFRGSQMLNFKIDVSKAREKRIRQLQYSNEIRSGSTLLQGREKLSLEIDSVTRLVVQSFRKLIDCERCALFLMDEKTNELYFKPIGDGTYSLARLKELRFPATSGVAGWVASNKQMLNIKNAYHDVRFNSDVDKKTGFRTRTILCHPVLSSANQMLGVIQMVNKKKTQGHKVGLVKKKGYQSLYEHFSTKDEEVLSKCCSEVSKALEYIYSKRDRRQTEMKSDDKNNALFFSDEGVAALSLTSNCAASSHPGKCEQESEGQSTETDSTSYISEPPRRDTAKRRSSVGELAQFIKHSSATKDVAEDLGINTRRRSSLAENTGIIEAVQHFRFRAPDLKTLRHREMERRLSDSFFLVAETKRKRMLEYSEQLRSTEKYWPSLESESASIIPDSAGGELTPVIKQSSLIDATKDRDINP